MRNEPVRLITSLSIAAVLAALTWLEDALVAAGVPPELVAGHADEATAAAIILAVAGELKRRRVWPEAAMRAQVAVEEARGYQRGLHKPKPGGLDDQADKIRPPAKNRGVGGAAPAAVLLLALAVPAPAAAQDWGAIGRAVAGSAAGEVARALAPRQIETLCNTAAELGVEAIPEQYRAVLRQCDPEAEAAALAVGSAPAGEPARYGGPPPGRDWFDYALMVFGLCGLVMLGLHLWRGRHPASITGELPPAAAVKRDRFVLLSLAAAVLFSAEVWIAHSETIRRGAAAALNQGHQINGVLLAIALGTLVVFLIDHLVLRGYALTDLVFGRVEGISPEMARVLVGGHFILWAVFVYAFAFAAGLQG